jgi:hypothetical protein
MSTTHLPAYVFDTRLHGGGRYRRLLPDGRLGRLVSRQEFDGWLRTIAGNAEVSLADLAEDVLAGRLLPADFQQAGQYILKHLYNAYSALARGGWAQMDFAAWGRNGRILGQGTREYPVGEYRSLAQFAKELAQGEMSIAQARARAELYVGRAFSRYWSESLLIAKQHYTEVLWIDVGGPEECLDCLALAILGWLPISELTTIPGAGNTTCLGNCRCSLAYR